MPKPDPILAAWKDKPQSTIALVEEMIELAPKPISIREIVFKTDKSFSAVRQAVWMLHKMGIIEPTESNPTSPLQRWRSAMQDLEDNLIEGD